MIRSALFSPKKPTYAFLEALGSPRFLLVRGCQRFSQLRNPSHPGPPGRESFLILVHRLAYNSDAAAGKLAVFQGASEATISEWIRVERRLHSGIDRDKCSYKWNTPTKPMRMR